MDFCNQTTLEDIEFIFSKKVDNEVTVHIDGKVLLPVGWLNLMWHLHNLAVDEGYFSLTRHLRQLNHIAALLRNNPKFYNKNNIGIIYGSIALWDPSTDKVQLLCPPQTWTKWSIYLKGTKINSLSNYAYISDGVVETKLKGRSNPLGLEASINLVYLKMLKQNRIELETLVPVCNKLQLNGSAGGTRTVRLNDGYGSFAL